MGPQTIEPGTMVDEKPHEVADRPQGLLNRRYRKYLLGESDIESHTQAERDVRASIRQRLFHGLLDFALIHQFLEQRDIDQSIGNVDGEQRLSRDTAIANAIALFLDLGSSEGLADTAEFERYVERAAKLSWHAQHDAVDDSNVWLGEPDVDLTIHFPERIDKERLASKVVTIWTRLAHLDRGEPEGDENVDMGNSLGLDSLSGDEVLYLVSELMTIQNGDKDIPEAADDDPGVEVLWEVARVWLAWRQNARGDFLDPVQELGADVIQAINQEDDLGDTIYL